MKRPTEMYPRAWVAHHKLQWGPNWRHVWTRYQPPQREKPMSTGA